MTFMAIWSPRREKTVAEAYPLYWPDGWKRTPPIQREWNPSFKSGFAVCRDELMRELGRLGAANIVLSTNIPLRRDGLPYADFRQPDDPGVAVYFTYHKRPMCFACDKYLKIEWNIRALALTIEAIRGIERWGASDMMERAFRGFAALPENGSQGWREVLGFGSDERVTSDTLSSRFRELALKHHPDRGGNSEAFQRIVTARDQAETELAQ